MKIALINIIKPQYGSGDGITEYTYHLYMELSKRNRVELVYALEQSKRMDIRGLLYTNTFFKLKAKRILGGNFDVVHITNQELGFLAKMLKKQGFKGRIITTIHDLMRVESLVSGERGYTSGSLQKIYNHMVRKSVSDALNYSDYVIFSSELTQEKASGYFGRLPKNGFIPLGLNGDFLRRKGRKVARHGSFDIGYVGALSYRKNVIALLRTAKLVGERDKDCRFLIYGTGPENDRLRRYAEENKLGNVKFMGFAPESKLISIYDRLDVFALPAFWKGQSLPVLNAQARGLPVLVWGGNKKSKMLRPYCFEAHSDGDAASIILEIKSDGFDPKTRVKELEYVKKYSWKNIAKETLEAYKNIG